MIPVPFKGADMLMSAENCIALPVLVRDNATFETKEYISCWQPTEDEIVEMMKSLKSGERPKFFVHTIGLQPPLYIGTDNPEV